MEMEHTTIFGLPENHLSERPGHLGCPVSALICRGTNKVVLTPCFEVPQVKEDASVPVECNKPSSNVIENM